MGHRRSIARVPVSIRQLPQVAQGGTKSDPGSAGARARRTEPSGHPHSPKGRVATALKQSRHCPQTKLTLQERRGEVRRHGRFQRLAPDDDGKKTVIDVALLIATAIAAVVRLQIIPDKLMEETAKIAHRQSVLRTVYSVYFRLLLEAAGRGFCGSCAVEAGTTRPDRPRRLLDAANARA
jgi:hypothetical protein